MPARRDRLARQRAAKGYTQESLAAHLGLERSTVGRWERGTGTPQPWHQPALAKALDLSPDTLADLLGPEPRGPAGHTEVLHAARNLVAGYEWPDRHPTGPARLLDPPWTLTGTLQVLYEVAGGLVDRRGFLIITGGALTSLANQWGSALSSAPLPTAHAEDHQGRLSTAILDRTDNRLAGLRQLDDALGGRELYQLAVAEFRYLTHLADQATYDSDSAAGQRLFGLVTEAARLCGWLHWDAGHHAAAQSYYVAALRSSAIANDPLAGAHVLARMSLQASATGHHQEAVALIDAAEEQTKHAATFRLRALLASRKARAYAKAGDATSCGRALNEAERHLDTTTPGTEEPDWIYYLDEAELAYHAAACWVDLRQPAKARPLIDNALSSMNPHHVRDRALYHVSSAEAHLQTNNLELACDDLHIAADLAGQTGSARAIDIIRSARGEMSRYNREPWVQELDRHLANLAV